MQSTLFQNKDYILLRKPHGIPSTFGLQESFLDILKQHLSDPTLTLTPLSKLLPADLLSHALSHLEGFEEMSKTKQSEVPHTAKDGTGGGIEQNGEKSSKIGDDSDKETLQQGDIETIWRRQVDTFGQEQEYGLLNRLDNETAGFLYFAKTPEAFANFKSFQKSGLIKKYYLAHIEGELKHGNMETWKDEGGSKTSFHTSTCLPSSVGKPVGKVPQFFHINFPIMHRKSNSEKMIAIRNAKDICLGRGKEHDVSTQVDILDYDPQTNLTTILVTITRGIRHQIRVHFATNGTPILGDDLYGKRADYLHLRSLGFHVDK